MGLATNIYELKCWIAKVRSVTPVVNAIVNDLLHNDFPGTFAAIVNILCDLFLPRTIATHPIPRVTSVRSLVTHRTSVLLILSVPWKSGNLGLGIFYFPLLVALRRHCFMVTNALKSSLPTVRSPMASPKSWLSL
jgi:hypothetical protein